MNHAMYKPLFGKHELQESIQESWNHSKISESTQQKFGVTNPPPTWHLQHLATS